MSADDTMATMNLFESTQKDKKKSFFSHYSTEIEKLKEEKPQLFQFTDKEATWDLLCEEFKNKPASFLRSLYNAMVTNNKYSAERLIDCFMTLDNEEHVYYMDQVTNNVIYAGNILQPLAGSLASQYFSWDLVDQFEVADDFMFYSRVLPFCTHELSLELFRKLYSKKDSWSDETYKAFFKHEDSITDTIFQLEGVAAVFYLESLDLAYYDEFPGIVSEFIGKVPANVLSGLLFMKHLDRDVNSIRVYEDRYSDVSFWDNTFGFDAKITDETSKLSVEQLATVMATNLALYGDYDFITAGDNAIADAFLKRIMGNGTVCKSKDRNNPIGYVHKNYIAGRYSMCFFDANIPFMTRTFNSFLDVLCQDNVENVHIDNHSEAGATKFELEYLIPIDYDGYILNNYTVADLKRLFTLFDREALDRTLGLMYELGDVVKCYDWLLLYTACRLYKEGFDFQYWMQLYFKQPALYSAAMPKLLLARAKGAKDFDDLLKDTTTGYEKLTMLSYSIEMSYNKAAAAYVRLFMLMHWSYKHTLLPLLNWETDSTLELTLEGKSKTITADDIIEHTDLICKSLQQYTLRHPECERIGNTIEVVIC